jgi:predicted neutral ceramidase superfamily lipid hydrolase
VGEKAKVKETVRLYTKVWQLPTYRQIVTILVLLTACTSLLSTTVKTFSAITTDFPFTWFCYLILLGVPVFVGTGLLYLIGRDEGSPMDARRTAGAVMFGLIFWFIFGMIGVTIDGILGTTGYEIRFLFLGAGIAYFMFAFLTNGLSDHSMVRNCIGALSPIVLWLLLENIMPLRNPALPNLGTYWYITAILIILVPTLVVRHIYRAVSVPFERDLGINGPQLLRAFGHDYLADNSEPLETILTKISTKQSVPMEIILFKENDKAVACGVVEYVHPGPFRDIGSSSLPSTIMKHIQEKYGIPSFVLHGTCTHHQNLTTKEDYPKVLDEIDRLINETVTYPTVSGPHWTDGDKFKVWTLFVGPDVLTLSTSAPNFTDDIALEVGYDTANMIRKQTQEIEGISVADAHNCINDDAVSVMRGDPDASEYIGTVSAAVFATLNEKRSQLEMSIYTMYPDNISRKDGIGPGGISVVVLRTEEQEMALVSVDGNNVNPGFREEVISFLKDQGFDNVEITTTDTHVVNAISLSSRGYPPVGRNKPLETLENIGIAATKARENIRLVSAGLGFGKVDNIRTFGEKGFDTLTQNVAEAAGIAKRVGLRLGGLAFLTLVLISFLV